jgi:hypothetical protein
MARDIDMSDPKKWSHDDKVYLAQRGLLPVEVSSVEEQRRMLDPEQGVISWEDRVNTGDVNLANVTTEELERELKARADAQESDPRKLFTKEGKSGALAEAEDDVDSDDEDEDEDDSDYESWSKDKLLTELGKRNDQREADGEDTLPLSGNKAELAARLHEDDGE